MKAILVFLLLFSASAAYALDGDPHPLGAASLRRLVETPQYRELETLYEKQRKIDNGQQPSRQRRMLAALNTLRAEAISATTIDPRGSEDRVANFTDHAGVVIRLTSIVPSQVDADEGVRNDVAGMIAGFIIDNATTDGRLPFDLPPTKQKAVDEAMKKGYVAAEKKDYVSAVRYFEEARVLAPGDAGIYYNLGLAASNIPGGEFRGIVWFGAYLAADPGSPRATAIREKIQTLDQEALTRFIDLMTEIAGQTSDQVLKDLYFEEITDLWAGSGNFTFAFQTADKIQRGDIKVSSFAKIAGAQARHGDFDAAFATAARILDADGKSTALRDICDAKVSLGDIPAALKIVPNIESPWEKSFAKLSIAGAQTEAGDTESALKTIVEALAIAQTIKEPNLKPVAQQRLSQSQAKAGDIAGALRSTDSIASPFNISIAKNYIAEMQAKAGDWDGAEQTLAAALDAAGKSLDYEKELALQAYKESKGRIEARLPGPAEAPTVAPPPAVSVAAWIAVNDTLLNTEFFLDLRAYLKNLPQDNPSKIWEPLEAQGKKMIEAHELMGRMLKEQEKQAARL